MALSVLAAVGCSTTQYREAADREAYRVIARRSVEVPGMTPSFSIEEAGVSLDGLAVVTLEDTQASPFLGDVGKAEVGCCVIPLEKALEIAVKNSRAYQSRKEALYIQALDFTETRQRYRPVFEGRATAQYAVETYDVSRLSDSAQFARAAPDLAVAVGNLVGTPADLLNAYADIIEAAAEVTGADQPDVFIEADRSLSGTTRLDASVLMRGGTRIAVALTSDFLRFVTGDPRVNTSSALVASIQQPLLGSQRRAAAETLTQAEHDLLYAIRSFTRYRKSFSVNIASEYYHVLQSRDTVRNNWLGYEAFKTDLERAEAEAEVGRKTKTDLGRTKQGELQAKNRWLTSVQGYQDSLDAFKIDLGLPTDARIVLDPGELDRLMERGLAAAPSFTMDDAVQVALAARLDYYTQRDRLEDAVRRVRLAKEGLMPDVSASLAATVRSPEDGDFNDLDFKHYAWNLGIDLDPKLNRKAVRNSYRKALINLAAAHRQYEELEDQIKLGVRQAWRQLEQARVSYEIQRNSLRESERRVLHQQLLRDIGEGKTLDMIDAQNDRIQALNSVLRAMVDHRTAYLRLWLEIGILYVKEDGRWEEVTDVRPG